MTSASTSSCTFGFGFGPGSGSGFGSGSLNLTSNVPSEVCLGEMAPELLVHLFSFVGYDKWQVPATCRHWRDVWKAHWRIPAEMVRKFEQDVLKNKGDDLKVLAFLSTRLQSRFEAWEVDNKQKGEAEEGGSYFILDELTLQQVSIFWTASLFYGHVGMTSILLKRDRRIDPTSNHNHRITIGLLDSSVLSNLLVKLLTLFSTWQELGSLEDLVFFQFICSSNSNSFSFSSSSSSSSFSSYSPSSPEASHLSLRLAIFSGHTEIVRLLTIDTRVHSTPNFTTCLQQLLEKAKTRSPPEMSQLLQHTLQQLV